MQKPNPRATSMTPTRPTAWLPLALLAGALIIWAGLFAAGAYLELGADAPHHDLRKPLIIMGVMATFLGLWGIALLLRRRRLNR
jgi:hypothetical protein